MARWYERAAHRRALVYILFSAVMLTVILIWAVLPIQREISEIRQEKKSLETEVEKQQILHPLYAEIVNRKDEKIAEPDMLESPEQLRQDSLSLDQADSVLISLAEDIGLPRADFSPDPDSLDNNPGMLKMDGTLYGPLEKFRELLLFLSTSPALGDLELLEIRGTEAYPEYILQIWVHLDREE